MSSFKGFFKVATCTAVAAVMAVSGVAQARGAANAGAKYVFFFIGDGMASVQIQAAEAYLAKAEQNADGSYAPEAIKEHKLNMSTMPVCGMATTYAADRFITDSASAATALACGIKAKTGVISQKLDGSSAVTIAELAKATGKKVGIISSVSIDHATPACFYAHNTSRNNYYDIDVALANSDFDFFGGGGIKRTSGYAGNPLTLAQTNGFTVTTDAASLAAVAPGTRVVAYDPYLDGGKALYYDIDENRKANPETSMSLAQYTSEAIRLMDNNKGFFMMVEGGKIDWACHANDARSAIDDTIAFDNAIGVAMDFYAQHPQETLIVVTGDHECGGMTVGFAGTGYGNAFYKMQDQTLSYDEFGKEFMAYAQSHPWSTADDNIDADLKALVMSCFGLDYDSLSSFQQSKLEAAYDRSRSGAAIVGSEEDYLLYGGYDAFTVTVTHLQNQSAGIAFTSYSHTGVPVPVYAIGKNAYRFEGFYDNTDVAKYIAEAMKVNLNN